MLVLPIPDIDGGAALAGDVPIQTAPTITALLNNIRIDVTSTRACAPTHYASLIEKARRAHLRFGPGKRFKEWCSVACLRWRPK
jgi:hypothetical protein